MDELNKRIVELMIKTGHSKSTFARELDVSLPLITHITTGRNKPGVELIQRILQRFTEVSPDWLLNGQGDMNRLSAKTIDMSAPLARLQRLKSHTNQPLNTLDTVIQYHKILMDELMHIQEMALLIQDAKQELAKLETEIGNIQADIRSEVGE